jgi:hypothetical protein
MQTEAIPREDWERKDAGLPPKKKVVVVKEPPELPKVANQITFDDIPVERFGKLISASRRAIKNDQGIIFIGYDVMIEIKAKKRGPGRPSKEEVEDKDDKERIISGWMLEHDWFKFYRHARENIDPLRIAV